MSRIGAYVLEQQERDEDFYIAEDAEIRCEFDDGEPLAPQDSQQSETGQTTGTPF